MRKDFILLLLIIFLAELLRLFRLGEVPFGIIHDELGYIFNAYSIAHTRRNVFGELFPFFAWLIVGGFPFMNSRT